MNYFQRGHIAWGLSFYQCTVIYHVRGVSFKSFIATDLLNLIILNFLFRRNMNIFNYENLTHNLNVTPYASRTSLVTRTKKLNSNNFPIRDHM